MALTPVPNRLVRWFATSGVAAAGVRPPIVRSLWIVPLRALLARWQVPAPASMRLALSTVQERTGFTFERVLCIRASLGDGLQSFALLEAGTSTLVVSEQLVLQLTADRLVALLAHEAKRVVIDGVNRKWGIGPVVGMSVLATAGAEQLLSRGIVTPFALAGYAGAIVAIHMLRDAWGHQMAEAQEAEFDDFVADRSGALSMLGRLDLLGANTPPAADIRHRWARDGSDDRQWIRILK